VCGQNKKGEGRTSLVNTQRKRLQEDEGLEGTERKAWKRRGKNVDDRTVAEKLGFSRRDREER